MPASMDVTRLLRQWSDGDPESLDHLMPLLYEELKKAAHARRLYERSNHTLNTTALVHEVYLKLVDVDGVQWRDRAHFLALASRMMRRILVDYARRRNTARRGGDVPKLALQEELIPDGQVETLLELDDALERLEHSHKRAARSAELYYFGGLSLEEAGRVLEVSTPTVMRDVRFAEVWLRREWNRKPDLRDGGG